MSWKIMILPYPTKVPDGIYEGVWEYSSVSFKVDGVEYDAELVGCISVGDIKVPCTVTVKEGEFTTMEPSR